MRDDQMARMKRKKAERGLEKRLQIFRQKQGKKAPTQRQDLEENHDIHHDTQETTRLTLLSSQQHTKQQPSSQSLAVEEGNLTNNGYNGE